MSLSKLLANVSKCARRSSEVHEATELFIPLAKRFRDVHCTMMQQEVGEAKRETVNQRFGVALRTFRSLITQQKQMPLATRVLNVRAIAHDVEILYRDLDQVVATMGEHARADAESWRSEFERAKQGHVELLEKRIDSKRDRLLRNSSLAKETIKLLKRGSAKDRWSPVAEKLWNVVESLATINEEMDAGIWFIPESDIDLIETCGKGGYATAYIAKWMGSNVVAKVINDFDSLKPKQLTRFMNEVEIGYRYPHPHVIRVYGACHTRRPPLIVFESAELGNMSNYLALHKEKAPIWWMLHEAAKGLQFLHSKKIVHGDLKLDNFFVMADGTVKLGDLGLSRRKATSRESVLSRGSVDGAGGFRFRAPECFEFKPTAASDVYSLAMCIYEAITGRPPYDLEPSDGVREKICGGKLPPRPACMSDEVWDLIKRMTQFRREARLSLDCVVGALKDLSDRERWADDSPSTTPGRLSTCDQCTDEGNAMVSAIRPLQSIAEAVEALGRVEEPDFQRRGLHWMYRNCISTSVCRELVELDGISKLEAIIDCSNTPRHQKMYAFHLLHRANKRVLACALTAMVNSLKKTLQRPNDQKTRELYNQMRGDFSDGDRLEAVDLLSMYFFHDLFEGHIDERLIELILQELVRLLRVYNTDFNAAAIMAMSGFACGAKTKHLSKLKDAVEPFVRMLRSSEDRCRHCALIGLANMAAGSEPNAAAIASPAALRVLVDIIKIGSDDFKEEATRVFCNLVAKIPVEVIPIEIMDITPVLVGLVENGSNGCKVQAARLLGVLCRKSSKNRSIVVVTGAVGPLVSLTKTRVSECMKFAAFALGNIADDSSETTSVFESSGAIDALVDLLKTGSSRCKAEAACALGQLAARSPRSKIAMLDSGAIGLLVNLTSTGADSCQEQAASALANIVSNSPDLSSEVTKAGAIDPLTMLVKTGSERCKRHACRALSNLACNSLQTKIDIVNAGAVAPLVDLLKIGSSVCKEWAACVLYNLATESLENQRKIAVAGAIGPLVELLKAQSSKANEWAAWALGHLATNSRESRLEILSAGAIHPLAHLLRSTEPCRDSATFTIATLSLESSAAESIVTAGTVDILVGLLGVGSQVCKEWVTCTLHNLADKSLENQRQIAAAGATGPLAERLKSPSSKAKEWAVCTLGRLIALSRGAKMQIFDPGSIGQLVQLLHSASENDAYWAAYILESQSSNSSTKRLIVNEGAVPALRNLRKHPRIGAFAKAALKNLGYGSIRRLFRSTPPD